jgi:hypothetical protein
VPRGDGSDARGGRRGRSGGVPVPALRPQGESYDAAQRRQALTDEVRTPPDRLTIVDTADRVTITDDKERTRTFHPDGRAEVLPIDNAQVLTTVRRDAGTLVVLYSVADLRQIRYTFSRPDGGAQLVVDVQFLDRGRDGDAVRRVYTHPSNGPSPSATTSGRGTESGADSAQRAAAAPPSSMPRAGSEFTGLTRLGLVVEEPSAQAVACGLTREGLEKAVAPHFTDAGLKISTNADEDTYVYVTVITSALPNGMCITRFDWAINSTTEATLSYQHTPLLAQVVLARKGGLTGSMPATHAADVVRAMSDGLDQIAQIIRNANR